MICTRSVVAATATNSALAGRIQRQEINWIIASKNVPAERHIKPDKILVLPLSSSWNDVTRADRPRLYF